MNKIDKQNLEESYYIGLFEKLQAVKLDGQKIGYTSKEIRKEFIKDIIANNFFASQSTKNKIIELVKNKRIIPIYSSKHNINIFFNVGTYQKSIQGFCYPSKNKSFIIVFTNHISSSITQKIKPFDVWKICSHELMHYLEVESSSQYYGNSLIRKDIKKWYYEFFKKYFYEADLNDKTINLAINAIIKNNIINNKIGNFKKLIYNVKNILMKYFWKDDDSNATKYDKIFEKIELLINIVSFVTGTVYGFPQINSREDFFHYFTCCEKAYRSIISTSNSKTINSFYGQEFIILSEISAIAYSNDVKLGNKILTTITFPSNKLKRINK